MFLTVLGIQLVCIAYISVGVEDSRGPGSRYSYPDTELELVRGSGVIRRYLAILDRKQLAEVFRVTFKRREGGMRRVILCLVLLMLLNVTIFSDGGVLYLFARKQFHWDEQIYTKFLTCTISKCLFQASIHTGAVINFVFQLSLLWQPSLSCRSLVSTGSFTMQQLAFSRLFPKRSAWW